MNRLPETNTGVVTSWIPITSAYPHQAGCDNYLWKYVPSVIAAWDPGYGIEVDADVTCLPKPVTTWWLQDRFGPIKETVLSLGPITCPTDYYTATASAKDASSTYVACCPFNYTFVKFMGPGGTGECTSILDAGSVVTYAERDSSWKITSSSVTTATTVAAIPVNGWTFATPTGSTTGSANTCDASVSEALANQIATGVAAGNESCDAASASRLSAGAAAGIGVGVSLGITGLAALGAGLFMMYRTRRAARKRPAAAHIAQFTNSGGKDMDPSKQVFPTYSPAPRETPSPSEMPPYNQPYERDMWDASTPILPPSRANTQSNTYSNTHSNARTVPHGEMEGTTYSGMDDRTIRRMELEGTPYQGIDSRTMGLGVTGSSPRDAEEERRRMELEGEFDRNVKVSLTSPWVATARPVPSSSSSQYHPPY